MTSQPPPPNHQNYPQQPGQQPPPGWAPPGAPGYAYPPPPPRKRRVWPWILGGFGAFFLLIIIIGIAAGGSQPSTPSVTGAPGAPPAAAPDSAQVAFDSPYRWTNEEIVISAPRRHVESNEFLQPKDGNRYIEFDVTVRNIGSRDKDIIGVEITVVHAGRAAQEAYMAGSAAFPQGRIPPGGEVTFTQVYEISADPGEMRVSVRPDFLAGTTAYWVGQV